MNNRESHLDQPQYPRGGMRPYCNRLSSDGWSRDTSKTIIGVKLSRKSAYFCVRIFCASRKNRGFKTLFLGYKNVSI